LYIPSSLPKAARLFKDYCTMKYLNTLLIVLMVFLHGTDIWAQQEAATPQAVKVLEEKTDENGYIVRKIQYIEKGMKVTKTTISPPAPSFKDRKPFNLDTMDSDSLMVLVEKSKYLVAIIYKKKRIRQYRAVFGPEPTKDKLREGDRNTPEGWFKILSIRDNPNWGKFIHLNYPTEDSYKKHKEAKAKGLIPQNATIGHSIGIHGTYPTGAGMVEMGLGWTDGCISMTTTDIMDFYKFVKPGTRVLVRK
jgi:murein L,D-transpeptidase YafK